MSDTAQRDFIPDAELYDKMAVPFASKDEADAAFSAFVRAVAKLRRKHRIRDVAIVLSASTQAPGDTKAEDCVTGSFMGGASREPFMLAWGLGRAQKSAHKRLAEAVMNAIDGNP